MDRSTRDKFTAMTNQKDLRYGESACVETPPDVFDVLHAEFNFDIDLTANEQNSLLPRWLGPGSPDGENALTASWRTHGKSGFSNPPYGSFVSKIVPKAVEEAKLGFLSVFLLPLRANRTFKDYMLRYGSIRFVDERITFWYKGKPKPTALNKKTGLLVPAGALFDSIIVIFGYQRQFPEVWHWDPARKIRSLSVKPEK